MEEIDVPPFFLCPISLEIMKDPVTLSTGITYDRESIEKWVFSGKNSTCPVTKQALTDPDMTPNHTLRRLIQSWCTLNSSYGIERFPTPRQPISKTQIKKLLIDSKKSPHLQMKCLKTLRSLASENETNKKCLEAAGAVDFLASIIIHPTTLDEVSEDGFELTTPSDEALIILHNLKLSETALKSLIIKNDNFFASLSLFMQCANYESRTYAILLLKSVVEVADSMQLISIKPEFFVQLVQNLHDQISQKATKAILQLLAHICTWGRNRIKAVEAGVVTVLVDLLLDSNEKRTCELALMVLDLVCQCAEGREKLLKHGAGLAIVSKKILRVSHVASERAVRILYSISRFSASPSVVREMLGLGVVAKLCLVLQVDCGNKAGERAREILKLHARAWKNSPCIPTSLGSSYPS